VVEARLAGGRTAHEPGGRNGFTAVIGADLPRCLVDQKSMVFQCAEGKRRLLVTMYRASSSSSTI
jgi:hypothetical protein